MRAAIFGVQMPTVRAIYKAYEDSNTPRHSIRLSGGVIGEECERALWYSFRWAYTPEKFDGRMLRLFDTGHREEDRLVADLRRIGVEAWDKDPETGKQWAVFDYGGHFTGRLDGVCIGLPEAPKTPHLLECKTHSLKSFTKLKKDGVQKAHPKHYAQMQSYMDYMGLTRALYLAQCKDTDELYAERIENDVVHAAALRAKAKRIIDSREPPPRLHDDPSSRAAFACQWCKAREQCHSGQWSPRNCRTCIYARPAMDGDAKWICERHNVDLSIEDQESGCVHHLYITGLVPGEQVDCDPARGTVTYLIDGKEWVDGGEENPQE